VKPDWPSGWFPILNPSEQALFEAELAREIPPEHALEGKRASLLGRRMRHDDVLFELDDGRVAHVHLTWAVETSPDWPFTQIYPSFEAWCAIPDEDR
jgi:hypothetical protein